MSPRSRSARLPALLATLAIVVAACGSSTTSPTPSNPSSPSGSISTASPAASGSPAGPSASPAPTGAGSPIPEGEIAQVAKTILEQTARIRELPIKRNVPPAVLSEAELKEHTDRDFHKENPPEVVAATDRLFKGLGLIPEGDSLEKLYLELLASQVAGFYSPDDEKLFVVARTGKLGPSEKVTFSHEYTHALQDQSFDLDKLDTDQLGEGDRGLGRLALVEGDATLEMSYWSQQYLSQDELLQLVQESSDPETLRILNAMPAILRESLLFPYQTGLNFVLGIQVQGGWQAVDDVYAKLPASTEQVIHPEKYAAGEMPVDVKLPTDLAKRMGEGWKIALEDTFGEFQLGVWLRDTGRQARAGTEAAAGWGGDRLALLEGPDGAWGIALVTEWDSADDATQFADAATATVDAVGRPGAVAHQSGSTRVVVVIGSSDAVGTSLDRILGATGA